VKEVHCTLFDHRYMSRGIAMIRSLRRVVPDAQTWVLCLDSDALGILRQIREPGVHPFPLHELEAEDPELARCKTDGRRLIEYFFSAKPSLIAHVMRAVPDADRITYLDSDLWFLADPAPAFAELADASTLLTPHRFPESAKEHERFGRFNAGWVSFRRSPDGLAALQWWRSRCIEWCFDRVDEANKRFADQRYLDHLADRFRGIHAVRHPGANLAPWNVGGYRLTPSNGSIRVSEMPLLFFHVHGMRTVGRNLYVTPQDIYRGPSDPILREFIYRPYLKTVRSIDRELGPLMPPPVKPLPQLSRGPTPSSLEALKRYLRIARAFARGALIHVPE